MTKVAVYTAIFGGKDLLWDPLYYEVDTCIDYYCFTDNPDIRSDIYDVVVKSAVYSDITKNARFFKIFGADELMSYDYTIWHDGNIQIMHDHIKELCSYLNGDFMATFGHPHRECVYDESITCIKRNKDRPTRIFWQVFSYFMSGMPLNSGVFETAILVRDRRYVFPEFYDFWWYNILRFTRRDQIALAFIVWTMDVSVAVLPGCRQSNIFGEHKPHLNDQYKISDNVEQPSTRFTKLFFVSCIVLLKFLRGFSFVRMFSREIN